MHLAFNGAEAIARVENWYPGATRASYLLFPRLVEAANLAANRKQSREYRTAREGDSATRR